MHKREETNGRSGSAFNASSRWSSLPSAMWSFNSSSYSSSSLGRSFSLSDDDLHSLSLDVVVLTFARDDTLLYRLLQRFSLPAKVNLSQTAAGLGKLDFCVQFLLSRILKFSPKKPTRSHSPEQ